MYFIYFFCINIIISLTLGCTPHLWCGLKHTEGNNILSLYGLKIDPICICMESLLIGILIWIWDEMIGPRDIIDEGDIVYYKYLVQRSNVCCRFTLCAIHFGLGEVCEFCHCNTFISVRKEIAVAGVQNPDVIIWLQILRLDRGHQVFMVDKLLKICGEDIKEVISHLVAQMIIQ